MKKLTIILDEQQIRTVGEFLTRTSLKGSEVPAFLGIMNALKNAKEIEAPKIAE